MVCLVWGGSGEKRKGENSFPTSGSCLEPEKENEETPFSFSFSVLHLPFTLSFSHFQSVIVNFVVM